MRKEIAKFGATFCFLLVHSLSQSGYAERREQTEVLSLSDALAMTVAGNPELEGYSWDVRATEARVLQASVLPNPIFNPQLEDFGGSDTFSGTDQAQTTLLITQLVELGGKRTARKEVAAQQKDAADLSYQRKRTEVLRDVSNKFHHVAADQERLELAGEMVKLASNTLQNIRGRVKAGKSSNVEEKKAFVLLSQARINEEHREHELAASKLRLASSWGADQVLFQRVKPILFEQAEILSYSDLIQKYKNSPTLKQWTLAQQISKAEYELAKAGRVPDITFGVGYRRFESSDDNALVAQLSVPLPLFDRNQHRISEASALRQKTNSMMRAADLRSKEQLFGLYQELHHAELEMKMSKTSILPQAKEAFDSAKQGFNLGSFSYLELSDAQRIYFDAKLNYIQAALEYHERIGEIENILGSSILKNAEKNFNSEQ